MSDKINVCLFNDSFPPYIDGVINVVTNYANIIENKYGHATVVVPNNPKADDSKYDFSVVRYQSYNTQRITLGYRTGNPLAVNTQKFIKKLHQPDIIHSHCPLASTYAARIIREKTHAPLIMTYHTKFDIELDRVMTSTLMKDITKKLLSINMENCDEIWAVSNGAADNARSLGYVGNIVVMPNGVDIPKKRAPHDEIAKLKSQHNIKENTPVFLFVGILVWYKGIKIILDALNKLNLDNEDFKMFFVGSGSDSKVIKEYCSSLNLDNKCIFTGPIYDREVLTTYYSMSDLFLFPSTFDTNGIVVGEAAATSLASVLIKDSAAAENIVDGETGILIEENSESLYEKLKELIKDLDGVHRIGENAADKVYLSWEDAVDMAVNRYNTLIDMKKSGLLPKKDLKKNDILETFIDIDSFMHSIIDSLK